MAGEQLPVHHVAVVVFCTVPADHEPYARYIADAAVRQMFRAHAPDGRIPLRLRNGDTLTVQVHAVEDVTTAAVNGHLTVRATDRAYPREEHPDA